MEREVLVERVVNSGITDEDVQRLQAQVEEERAQVEEQLNLERQAIEAQKVRP